jgi:hypothetical protein
VCDEAEWGLPFAGKGGELEVHHHHLAEGVEHSGYLNFPLVELAGHRGEALLRLGDEPQRLGFSPEKASLVGEPFVAIELLSPPQL